MKHDVSFVAVQEDALEICKDVLALDYDEDHGLTDIDENRSFIYTFPKTFQEVRVRVNTCTHLRNIFY